MPSFDARAVGLIVWTISVAANVAGLLLDGALAANGTGSVSEYARQHAWAAVLILAANVAGLVGLAVHLRVIPNVP